ncbi:hypothetical protein JCM10450v2_006683 [Rhodotorula kratochvilovae]
MPAIYRSQRRRSSFDLTAALAALLDEQWLAFKRALREEIKALYREELERLSKPQGMLLRWAPGLALAGGSFLPLVAIVLLAALGGALLLLRGGTPSLPTYPIVATALGTLRASHLAALLPSRSSLPPSGPPPLPAHLPLLVLIAGGALLSLAVIFHFRAVATGGGAKGASGGARGNRARVARV